jgi:hypothetical protein
MNMDAELGLPPILKGIHEVGQWRRENLAELHRRQADVDRESAKLEADIAELQRQLDVCATLRAEFSEREAALPADETRRNREALLVGLDRERALIEARADALSRAGKAREDRVARLMEDAEIARLVDEFEQFGDVEPTLESLPAGYRSAILAHHDSVRRRLQPVFDAVAAELPPTGEPPAAFTIVAAVDPQEGTPDALGLIVPVHHDVAARWAERGEDLCSLIAYRIIGAVSGALADAGSADAPIQHSDYEGCLAIQVWLGDHPPRADIKEALAARFDRLREEASELRTTGLDVYLVWVSPDVVAPTEDDDDEEADDASA